MSWGSLEGVSSASFEGETPETCRLMVPFNFLPQKEIIKPAENPKALTLTNAQSYATANLNCQFRPQKRKTYDFAFFVSGLS